MTNCLMVNAFTNNRKEGWGGRHTPEKKNWHNAVENITCTKPGTFALFSNPTNSAKCEQLFFMPICLYVSVIVKPLPLPYKLNYF